MANYNPFDITTYDTPSINLDSLSDNLLMEKSVSTGIPYLDIELPSTKVEPLKPTFNPFDNYSIGNKSDQPKKTPESKDKELYNNLINAKYSTDRIAYTYNAGLDVRYKNLDYDPSKDMEKIYDENQSTWDIFKKQSSRWWNNLSNTVRDQYVGQGRFIYNLGQGQLNNNAFFNKPETLASYISSLNEEYYNPIYGKDNANWYSLKGWLGDTFASSGFAAGSIVSGLTDTLVGSGIKAALRNPISATILGLGTLALFNDSVRENLAEENANLILGMLGGGVLSNGISGGVTSLLKNTSSKVLNPQSISLLSSAIKDVKKGEDFSKILLNTVDNTLKNITSGTILDTTSQLAKNVKVLNTLDKSLTGGLTFAKMYLSSGAESGMEAIQAQYDYIGEKLTEAQKEGKSISDDEYQKIYQESLGMSQRVYNLNRALLGISNSMQFGDIIKGTFVKNKIKDYGIKYIENETLDNAFKITNNSLKSWYKNQLKNSLSEGFEEGAQFIISESNKDYLKNQLNHKSELDSFLYGVEKTLTTSEGWGNIMSGILTGLGMAQPASIIQGITQSQNGGTFLGGYTGFDEKQSKDIINQLKTQFKTIYDLTTNNKDLNKTLDSINNISNPQLKETIYNLNKEDIGKYQQHILDNIFNVAVSSIESGNSQVFKSFLNDYFDFNSVQNTTDIEGKQETQLDKLIKIFGEGKDLEKDKESVLKAKQDLFERFDKAETTIKSFQEFYDNPYTTNLIDKIVDNTLLNKVTGNLGIKVDSSKAKKEKAAIYDTMVKGAARTLFMKDEILKDTIDNRNTLIDILERNNLNKHFDLRPYILGNRKSYLDLINDLDFEINTIKEIDTNPENVLAPNGSPQSKKLSPESKEKLEILKKLKETLYDEQYEKILKGENEVEKEVLENSSSPLLNMIGNLWKDYSEKNGLKNFNDNKEFKYILHEINRLEEDLFFFSKDLKGFTTEKDQKKIVQYLADTTANMVLQQEKIKKINKSKEAPVTEEQEKVEDVTTNNKVLEETTLNNEINTLNTSEESVIIDKINNNYDIIKQEIEKILPSTSLGIVIQKIEDINKGLNVKFLGVEKLNVDDRVRLLEELTSKNTYQIPQEHFDFIKSQYDYAFNLYNNIEKLYLDPNDYTLSFKNSDGDYFMVLFDDGNNSFELLDTDEEIITQLQDITLQFHNLVSSRKLGIDIQEVNSNLESLGISIESEDC